jgi:hypothetical protein
MKSFATADFWKAYAELSPEMQEDDYYWIWIGNHEEYESFLN